MSDVTNINCLISTIHETVQGKPAALLASFSLWREKLKYHDGSIVTLDYESGSECGGWDVVGVHIILWIERVDILL